MPGQYYDSESGLFYNWNRYYNPAIGRYISVDLIGTDGGMNTFLYANANPLLYTDPEGLNPFAAIGACIFNPICRTIASTGVREGIKWAFPPKPTPADVVQSCPPSTNWNTKDEGEKKPKWFDEDFWEDIENVKNPPSSIPPNDDDPDEKNCKALRDSILSTCASLKGEKRMRCLYAAEDAYQQCMGD